MTDIAKLQKECQDFRPIIDYICSEELPTNARSARKITAQAQSYVITDDVLYHFYTARTRGVPRPARLIKQLAIPNGLRKDIIASYHDSIAGGGHLGIDRTYTAIRFKYFWPNMYRDITEYIESCLPCQKAKRHFHARKAPLTPMPISNAFERWHMDILELTITPQKYRYVLLVVDSFSRWCEAIPLKTQEASEVANALFAEVICRYGAPSCLVSDRGQNFMSKLVAALCELFEITRHHTSSYHPQTNSTVERLNSTIAQSLRTYANSHTNWPKLLPGIMMAFRMSPATQSTQYSPYELIFGKQMRLPIDTSLTPNTTVPKDFKVHLDDLVSKLKLIREIATENRERAQIKQKNYYDQNTRVPDYKQGDKVWLSVRKYPIGVSPKLCDKWDGPFFVTREGANSTYKLTRCSNNKPIKSYIHANRLKHYHDPEFRRLEHHIPVQNQVQRPQPLQQDRPRQNGVPANQQQIPLADDHLYEIEKLCAKKQIQGQTYFRVKWKGFKDTTWEPQTELPPILIQEYYKFHTRTGKRRKRKFFNPG